MATIINTIFQRTKEGEACVVYDNFTILDFCKFNFIDNAPSKKDEIFNNENEAEHHIQHFNNTNSDEIESNEEMKSKCDEDGNQNFKVQGTKVSDYGKILISKLFVLFLLGISYRQHCVIVI